MVHIAQYTYDKTGNLLTQNVGKNQDTAQDQTISSEYNEIGKLTTVTSEEGAIRYQYDDRGYLIEVVNARGEVVQPEYDELGRKMGMTYPDGRTVSYTYDSMNRLTSVMGLDGSVTAYAYDALGRRTETRTAAMPGVSGTADIASTLTTTYEYDSVGNLLRQATSGLTDISFAYSYNKNNYITSETRTELNAETGKNETATSAYTYDPLGQLTRFTKSDGYEESYTYDVVGNMLKKVMGTESEAVTLAMSYNKANQLTAMQNGKDKLAYTYDKNGSMVRKVLTSKEYGKLTDTYAYNSQDMLTSYIGYDGYEQSYTYDAMGIRQAKQEKGNSNRSTLEELLRGNVAGLPEIVTPNTSMSKASVPSSDEVEAGYEWATIEYLYDMTAQYYQVIQENMISKNGNTTTAYDYGLERIAGYTQDAKMTFVYDGRGSVAQAISIPTPGQSVTNALPKVAASAPQIQSFSYTPFGEQLGAVKVSGYTYNGEAYDAATGMLNLRARQYEPAMNRFSQKDIVRGSITNPISINRYSYCGNSAVSFVDPSGMFFEKLVTSAKNLITNVIDAGKKIVKTAATFVKAVVQKTTIDNAVQFALTAGAYTDLSENDKKIMDDAMKQLRGLDITSAKGKAEANRIFATACSLLNKNAKGEDTAADPTPSPTPQATPALPTAPQATPAPSRPDYWDYGMLADRIKNSILESTIPQYNQSAKQYAELTGSNTFAEIEMITWGNRIQQAIDQGILGITAVKDYAVGGVVAIFDNAISGPAILIGSILGIEEDAKWLQNEIDRLIADYLIYNKTDYYTSKIIIDQIAQAAGKAGTVMGGATTAAGLAGLANTGASMPAVAIPGGGALVAAEGVGSLALTSVGTVVTAGSAVLLESSGNNLSNDQKKLEESKKEAGNKGNDLVFGSEAKSANKLQNQMESRGWTNETVKGTVNEPYTTRSATNRATGNSATAYYAKDGSYVVVDDITNEVVQVSNKFDSNWAPDQTIIDPYIP